MVYRKFLLYSPGSGGGGRGSFDKMIPFFHCRVKRGKILAAHIFVHATKRFYRGTVSFSIREDDST